MMDPNSELFRAKQQVIYYRSEVAQYKNKIGELERLMEKEVVRNKYLQGKIRELNGEKIKGFEEEIQRLRKRVMEVEVEVEEEKLYKPTNDECGLCSFFNYSIILPQDEESTISIFGTYSIINEANLPIEDLFVCLKTTPVGAITFSAKISDPKLLFGPGKDREDIEWVYGAEDWLEKINKNGEYWLKNIQRKDKTAEKILLNFEANVNLSRAKKVEIDALIYTKSKLNHKKLNKIILLK